MNSGRMMVALLLLSVSPALAADDDAGKAATVQDVSFVYASPKSKLSVTFDKDVKFEKTVSESDKQVIIDVPNAKIPKKWSRRLQTSEHKTNVVMVSPYQTENRVRITLQLRDNGGVEVSEDGKTLVAMIDNKQEPAEKTADQGKDLTDTEKQAPVPDASKGDAAAGASGDTAAATTPAAEQAAASPAGDTSLDQFMRAQDTHKYYGKHIWLQVQDAELPDIFRIISEASEFNIVLSENVKGKVVLNLTDIPWDEALDIILRSYHLAAERQGNVLRITTVEAMTAEHDAEVAAKKSQELAEPLVVKIFPISYATAGELAGIIRDFMTKDTAAPALPGQQGPLAGQQQIPGQIQGLPQAGGPTNIIALTGYRGPIRGSIQIDQRTNALIVRDTASVMEKIKKIIKELDTPTPQILIEGKFVEVQESNSDSISGRLFLSNREFDPAAQQFAFLPGNNNYSAGFATSLLGGLTGALSPASAPGDGGAGFGFTPKANLLPGINEIGAFLNLTESEGTSRLIASPRVVTQNKEAATITSGQNVFLNGTNTTSGTTGGTTTVASTTQTSEITLTMTLTVTPQITNEGSVLLHLTFSQDTLATPVPGSSLTTNTKSISTAILVDSGGTIVIGGVYQSSDVVAESGIPVLRNLPIIGVLFGSKTKSESKDELFIFLTPRILNEKEAGLKG